MKKRLTKRQLMTGAVSLVVSVSLLTMLIMRIDLERAMVVLRLVKWQWLLAATIMVGILPFSSALRWQGVLRAYGNTRMPFGRSVRAVMMANVLNSFLPSKGGDLAKAVYLRKQVGLSIGFGTVFVERLVDLMVLGFLGAIAQTVNHNSGWGAKGGWFLLLFVFFLVVILLLPVGALPIPKKISSIYHDTKQLFRNWLKNPVAVIQTLAGSIITWCIGGSIVLALTRSFAADLNPSHIYAIYPTAVIAGLIPITVSGIGTRDSAFVILLSSYLPSEEATLVGIGYTIIAYWLLSLISFPVVSREITKYLRKK